MSRLHTQFEPGMLVSPVTAMPMWDSPTRPRILTTQAFRVKDIALIVALVDLDVESQVFALLVGGDKLGWLEVCYLEPKETTP